MPDQTDNVLELSSIKGPILMVTAAALFTVMSLIVKLMPERYTVWHIGFIRCFGGMMLLSFLFSRNRNPYKGYNIPLLLVRGLSGAAAFVFAVTALRMLPISTATVIFYTFPVFAALFSVLIYKETLSKYQVLCMLLVFCGVGVLFDFNWSSNLFGQAMALTGGLFAGLTVTLIRSLREKNGPVVIYLYFCITGSLVTLPMFVHTPVLPEGLIEWYMILGIVITSIVAQLMMNQGFFYCKGWEGSVYMSSETVFTAVAGISFLNDPATWRFFIGAGMIFLSGIVLSRLKEK